MKPLNVALGTALMLVFFALAVMLPSDVTMFGSKLATSTVDLLRLAIVFVAFIAGLAGWLE
jgi:hypothetical protein